MLGEIDEALGYITDWTPFAFLGVLGFFACVGAVTTLRWLVRFEYRLQNRWVARERAEFQRRMPPPNPTGPLFEPKPTPPVRPVVPLRDGPGPRDWSPAGQ